MWFANHLVLGDGFPAILLFWKCMYCSQVAVVRFWPGFWWGMDFKRHIDHEKSTNRPLNGSWTNEIRYYVIFCHIRQSLQKVRYLFNVIGSNFAWTWKDFGYYLWCMKRPNIFFVIKGYQVTPLNLWVTGTREWIAFLFCFFSVNMHYLGCVCLLMAWTVFICLKEKIFLLICNLGIITIVIICLLSQVTDVWLK